MRISDWSSDVCSSDLYRRRRPTAMQGWSAQSPRPPAPCFSGSKAGSFEHSLIDPEPRIALEAHDPLVEVGRQPIGRKAADVQCALDAALAREAARVEVDRDIARDRTSTRLNSSH